MNDLTNKFWRCAYQLRTELVQEIPDHLIALVIAGSAVTGDTIVGWSDLDIFLYFKELHLDDQFATAAIIHTLSDQYGIKIGANVLVQPDTLLPHKAIVLSRSVLFLADPDAHVILYGDKSAFPTLTLAEVRQGCIHQMAAIPEYVRKRVIYTNPADLTAVKETAATNIRSCFSLLKLALLYYGDKATVNKKDLLAQAKIRFPEFSIAKLEPLEPVRSRWAQVESEELLEILKSTVLFSESFTRYFLSQSKKNH